MTGWGWLAAVGIMGLLNLFQLIYWSRWVNKLIDKLMSRNYADYVASSREPAAVLPQQSIFNEQIIDQDKDLADLNNIMIGL